MSLGYIEGWFTPFMYKWLQQLANITQTWVASAIAADDFKPLVTKYSTSVYDMFTVMYAQLEFISNLRWSDHVQNAEFLQLFSKVMHS
jgi:hypothetical protein